LPNNKAQYVEICGSNPERQDYIIEPVSTPALGWSGYFCARISTLATADIPEYGVIKNGTKYVNESTGAGSLLSAYVRLPINTTTYDVRVGVSFISVEHARASIDYETPDGTTLEDTAKQTREVWAEKLDRLDIEGADEDLRQTVYTAFFHTLQVSITLCEHIEPR
jgi:putative alpha-1,2-mannosidase